MLQFFTGPNSVNIVVLYRRIMAEMWLVLHTKEKKTCDTSRYVCIGINIENQVAIGIVRLLNKGQ